jgi:hypothetical protein
VRNRKPVHYIRIIEGNGRYFCRRLLFLNPRVRRHAPHPSKPMRVAVPPMA